MKQLMEPSGTKARPDLKGFTSETGCPWQVRLLLQVLHIVGGTDVNDVSGGFLQLGNLNTYNMGLDVNELQARENGAASRLYIQRDGGGLSLASLGGNVVIGSVAATPGNYKLYVQTGILTERVKIATVGTAEWADYVFEEDYDLKSLDDIKQFVRKNKHLPNIPSAKEVEKNGYELQQMDAKLLEKIEELYLLTIQLNEEKQQIEKANKKLEAENEALKANQQDILKRLSKLEK